MASIFNKKIPHSCAWCIHGKPSDYTDEVFCSKRGMTNKNDSCHSYKYDPLKRNPVKARPADGYSAEDFKL